MANKKTIYPDVPLICTKSNMNHAFGRVFHAFHDCSALRRNPHSAGKFHVTRETQRLWYNRDEPVGHVREVQGGPIVGKLCQFCMNRLVKGDTPSGENPYDLDALYKFCKTLQPDEVEGLILAIIRETGVPFPPSEEDA